MGLGVLWFARIPPASHPWVFGGSAGQRFLPPGSYWVDLLPGYLLFGVGIMVMVAPLTTALMSSVPKHNSGVASAVNNAISRVGPQLAGAVKPEHFDLAPEVNVYLARHPEQLPRVLALLTTAAQAVKRASPATKVNVIRHSTRCRIRAV